MIHPTAVVDARAEIGECVEIGAYSIVERDVRIGDGTKIGPHVVVRGPTRIGEANRIFQFCSIGDDPQDKKYAGESTRLEIGDRNTIREGCTINRGTVQDLGYTRLGNDNWIMAYCHIAHACVLGDHLILANNATLGGHVVVDDYAVLGGFSGVHQFCSIGRHAFLGMFSAVSRDIPPFVTVSGNPARPRGINAEGMKRHGFSADQIQLVRRAYRVLFRSGLKLVDARAELEGLLEGEPALKPLVEFIGRVRRGVVR
jgi:UDP-N-acetylglucosamine acyltransferase